MPIIRFMCRNLTVKENYIVIDQLKDLTMTTESYKKMDMACGYIYLFSGYFVISLYYLLHIHDACKPLGLFFVSLLSLCFFSIYCVINHLVVSNIISHWILFIFEILLLFNLGCLFYTTRLVQPLMEDRSKIHIKPESHQNYGYQESHSND